MSFDVFLIASSATPNAAQFEKDVREVVVSMGGRVEADGVTVRTASGETFELQNGGMFALRDLQPTTCVVIFRAAHRTNSYVVAAGDERVAYKVKGLLGQPPSDFLPLREIADADDLCTQLRRGFEGWDAFAHPKR
jgi:hypothetical protein